MTRIGRIRQEVRVKVGGSLLNALRGILPDERIRDVCREELASLRERVLVPLAMIWYWVAAGLNREKSFAAVWNGLWTPVAVACPEVAGWRPDRTGVLTRARLRIPRAALRKLRAEVVRQAQTERTPKDAYRGHRLVIWDGSTVSMPDAAALRDAFGKPRNQHGEGPFPVARIVNLLDVATGTALASAWDHHRISEQELAWRTAAAVQPHDLVLSDSNFAGRKQLARLQCSKTDFLMEKEFHLDIRNYPRHRIGRGDWLVTVPIPEQARREEPQLPACITVRVIKRVVGHGKKRRALWLVTSLLDPRSYPADELTELYWLRWGIETSYEELKNDLHLEVLRSTTVEGAHKEIEAHLLGYNLVRLLMRRAAKAEGVDLSSISFLNAVRVVLETSNCMRSAPTRMVPGMYRTMLKEIAAAQNPERPGRSEPRAVRRDRKPFPLLRISRAEWRRNERLTA